MGRPSIPGSPVSANEVVDATILDATNSMDEESSGPVGEPLAPTAYGEPLAPTADGLPGPEVPQLHTDRLSSLSQAFARFEEV